MAKVYITRCIVKRNGVLYKNGSIIEELTGDEIEQGLAQHWLQAVGSTDETVEDEASKSKASRKKLVKQAEKLGIAATDEMTDEEIQQAITEAKARAQ
jgi:hypothetical protein